jgi:hypothetical protein
MNPVIGLQENTTAIITIKELLIAVFAEPYSRCGRSFESRTIIS